MQHDDSVPLMLDVCPSCQEKDDELERLTDLVEGCSRRNASDYDEIERLTMERDEARKLASEWSNEAGAEIERLSTILEDAPHDKKCSRWVVDDDAQWGPCNCWKSKL